MKRYRIKMEMVPVVDNDEESLKYPACTLIEDPKGNLLKYDEMQTMLKDLGQVITLLGNRDVEVDFEGNNLNIRILAKQ